MIIKQKLSGGLTSGIQFQTQQVGSLSQANRDAACKKLWQKYKCEKHASNIALYPTALTSTFDCFTPLFLYVMQNDASFRH